MKKISGLAGLILGAAVCTSFCSNVAYAESSNQKKTESRSIGEQVSLYAREQLKANSGDPSQNMKNLLNPYDGHFQGGFKNLFNSMVSTATIGIYNISEKGREFEKVSNYPNPVRVVRDIVKPLGSAVSCVEDVTLTGYNAVTLPFLIGALLSKNDDLLSKTVSVIDTGRVSINFVSDVVPFGEASNEVLFSGFPAASYLLRDENESVRDDVTLTPFRKTIEIVPSITGAAFCVAD